MPTLAPASSAPPPGRAVLRLAGALTQLACASCLLLGTIAFVLVQQNKAGGTGSVIAWASGALVGLVLGGLMTRGGLISLVGAAVVDAVFGVALVAIEYDTLRSILRVLPTGDVDVIADAMTGLGVAMLIVFALCLAAIPQALRYTRWMHDDTDGRLASSTARGFPPPPVAAPRGSVWQLPLVAVDESRSRRRLYFALAGFAVGFGAGIGVLVSSNQRVAGDPAPGATHAEREPAVATPRADVGSGGGAGSGPGSGRATVPVDPPPTNRPGPSGAGPVSAFVQAQRIALGNGDLKALVALVAPTAFGFGTDSDDIAEGRDAIEAQLHKNLGDLPAGGVNVGSKFLQVGEAADHAWIAMELEISGGDRPARRFAITELAAQRAGAWTIVAWQWALPVADAIAQRKAVLGTLPAPRAIANHSDAPKDVETAVRAALASRRAFADARSDHPQGFNFGSAPGERIVGGSAVKRVFGKLRAEIHVHDGIRIVASSPEVAYAAANIDFTQRTRAATTLTQTFRVLAIFLKEGADWHIVQTQWSHGGPIR